MKRTKLRDRQLPFYTPGEEIFNMVSHIVGGAMGCSMLSACVCVSVMQESLRGLISTMVYSLSVVLLFTMSSIYHGLIPEMPKKVFQVIDHCTIYVMIAGTFTPIAVCAIYRVNERLSWIMLTLVWAVAILAIVLTAIDLRRFRVFSMICYLGIGWSVLFVVKTMYQALTLGGFLLLVGGGVAYTVGAILYGLGRKIRYMHSVFHLFVLLGSLLHFFCIVFYVI